MGDSGSGIHDEIAMRMITMRWCIGINPRGPLCDVTERAGPAGVLFFFCPTRRLLKSLNEKQTKKFETTFAESIEHISHYLFLQIIFFLYIMNEHL